MSSVKYKVGLLPIRSLVGGAITLIAVSATLAACQPNSGGSLMNQTAQRMDARGMQPFPTVSGDNLLGETYRMPVDFDGALNLVMVAYYRHHQSDVNTWLPAARELDQRYLGFEYYELPVLHRGYKLMRLIIDNGMRSGIPSREARRRTITVYDKTAFNRQLGVSRDKEIRVMLVDGRGRIRWTATGPATEAALSSLRRAVADHLESPRRPAAVSAR